MGKKNAEFLDIFLLISIPNSCSAELSMIFITSGPECLDKGVFMITHLPPLNGGGRKIPQTYKTAHMKSIRSLV